VEWIWDLYVHRICIFVYNLVYGNTYDLDLTILILLMVQYLSMILAWYRVLLQHIILAASSSSCCVAG
jgi:hypothetical protein